MIAFTVEFTDQARDDLRRLDRSVRRRLMAVAKRLETNPYPGQAAKLVGRPGFRVRCGDYRIIYTVNETTITVLVIRIAHRSVAYDD